MQELIDQIKNNSESAIFSNVLVYDKLIHALAYLSGLWRETKDDRVAQQYQTILRTLVLIGFDDSLDVDIELPEELMPKEYIELFEDE